MVGKNVPGIPGTSAARNFTHLARGPCRQMIFMTFHEAIFRWFHCASISFGNPHICAKLPVYFFSVRKMTLYQIGNTHIFMEFSNNWITSVINPFVWASLIHVNALAGSMKYVFQWTICERKMFGVSSLIDILSPEHPFTHNHCLIGIRIPITNLRCSSNCWHIFTEFCFIYDILIPTAIWWINMLRVIALL